MKPHDHIYYATTVADIWSQVPAKEIEECLSILQYARLADRQIFVFGNGGSSSTASHFMCDLVKNTVHPNSNLRRFRVQAIADNSASFSAYANDSGYDFVFANQISALARPGDVVLGISTSGRSANVLQAVRAARNIPAITIGWTSENGDELTSLVDTSVVVPCQQIEMIEDIHMMLAHYITIKLRDSMGSGSTTYSYSPALTKFHDHLKEYT